MIDMDMLSVFDLVLEWEGTGNLRTASGMDAGPTIYGLQFTRPKVYLSLELSRKTE